MGLQMVGLNSEGAQNRKKKPFEMSYSTAVLIEVKTVFSFTIKAFKTSSASKELTPEGA